MADAEAINKVEAAKAIVMVIAEVIEGSKIPTTCARQATLREEARCRAGGPSLRLLVFNLEAETSTQI